VRSSEGDDEHHKLLELLYAGLLVCRFASRNAAGESEERDGSEVFKRLHISEHEVASNDLRSATNPVEDKRELPASLRRPERFDGPHGSVRPDDALRRSLS